MFSRPMVLLALERMSLLATEASSYSNVSRMVTKSPYGSLPGVEPTCLLRFYTISTPLSPSRKPPRYAQSSAFMQFPTRTIPGPGSGSNGQIFFISPPFTSEISTARPRGPESPAIRAMVLTTAARILRKSPPDGSAGISRLDPTAKPPTLT